MFCSALFRLFISISIVQLCFDFRKFFFFLCYPYFERIAAGKAVLARLNRGPHIVLAATHDIELAELLRGDGYELHHFREEVADGRLVFDYCLHTGPLTTRNAIRILELYDYPPELIAEAYDTQQKLLGNG